MIKKPAVTKQNLHLAAAYRKLPPEGRNALDRIVGQLAKTDELLKAAERRSRENTSSYSS
jgi:hypothetical protein